MIVGLLLTSGLGSMGGSEGQGCWCGCREFLPSVSLSEWGGFLCLDAGGGFFLF